MTQNEMFSARLDSLIQQAEVTLKQFKDQLDQDPAYALSWGDAAFEAAANLEIAKKLKEVAAVREADLNEVRGWLLELVMDSSRSRAASSSVTSNLMQDYKRVAASRIYDQLFR